MTLHTTQASTPPTLLGIHLTRVHTQAHTSLILRTHLVSAHLLTTLTETKPLLTGILEPRPPVVLLSELVPATS
jgi:hypothetical protein